MDHYLHVCIFKLFFTSPNFGPLCETECSWTTHGCWGEMEIGYPYFAKNFPPKEFLRTHSKSDMDGAEGVRVQKQLKPKFFKTILAGNFDRDTAMPV